MGLTESIELVSSPNLLELYRSSAFLRKALHQSNGTIGRLPGIVHCFDTNPDLVEKVRSMLSKNGQRQATVGRNRIFERTRERRTIEKRWKMATELIPELSDAKPNPKGVEYRVEKLRDVDRGILFLELELAAIHANHLPERPLLSSVVGARLTKNEYDAHADGNELFNQWVQGHVLTCSLDGLVRDRGASPLGWSLPDAQAEPLVRFTHDVLAVRLNAIRLRITRMQGGVLLGASTIARAVVAQRAYWAELVGLTELHEAKVSQFEAVARRAKHATAASVLNQPAEPDLTKFAKSRTGLSKGSVAYFFDVLHRYARATAVVEYLGDAECQPFRGDRNWAKANQPRADWDPSAYVWAGDAISTAITQRKAMEAGLLDKVGIELDLTPLALMSLTGPVE